MQKKTENDTEAFWYKIILKNVGANIKHVRSYHHMSQKELAAACSLETTSISKIESGKTNLTFFTLCKIARALNFTVAEFISDAESAERLSADYNTRRNTA